MPNSFNHPIRLFLRHLFFPVVETFTQSRFWSYYRQGLVFDRQGNDTRDKVRLQKLARILTHAQQSAFHRTRLEHAGVDLGEVKPGDAMAILNQLEPIQKKDLRTHFPTGVTTGPSSKDWRYLSTSGTTDRLSVIADFAARDHRRSSELRTLRVALNEDVAVRTVEIPPNACNVVCGLTDNAPPSLLGYFWFALRRGSLFSHEARTDLRGRFERNVVYNLQTFLPIDPAPPQALTTVLDSYLMRIRDYGTRQLRGFPVYLLWLADRCRNQGIAIPSLKVISPYGGLTSPQMAERISMGLGAPFRNKYGTNELGSMAVACDRGVGMHLFEDLYLVEILRGGKPVPPGETGKIVVTDLVNQAMPLIRYEVGDVGRLHTTHCPCGRQTNRLEVLGRVQETLDTPEGILTTSEIADTFFQDAAIANFRLEEIRPGSFDVALVADPSGHVPDSSAWEERFRALNKGVRKLRLKVVPFVQPESSGKYRFVHPLRESEQL